MFGAAWISRELLHDPRSVDLVQDTSSDLQLFAILSITLVVFGGVLKGTAVKFLDALLPLNDPSTHDAWWRNFYQARRVRRDDLLLPCVPHMLAPSCVPHMLAPQHAASTCCDNLSACSDRILICQKPGRAAVYALPIPPLASRRWGCCCSERISRQRRTPRRSRSSAL